MLCTLGIVFGQQKQMGCPPPKKTGEEEVIEEVMRENTSIGEATLLQ